MSVESTTTAAARADTLSKIYGAGEAEVRALDGVSVTFAKGRFTAIMGPSGSGKSTLMHVCAGLDDATSGTVSIGDTNLTSLGDSDLTRLRRDRVGFIFQSFNLVPTLTALENITLPLDIAGRKPDQEWLDKIIDMVGMRDRLKQQAKPALRRSAAAGGCRSGARHTARDHLRRRANRKPRLTRRASRCSPSFATAPTLTARRS